MLGENVTTSVKVHPHPKADIDVSQLKRKPNSVGSVVFSMVAGFVLAMTVGAVLVPAWAPAIALGGAMLGGAIRVGFLLSKPPRT